MMSTALNALKRIESMFAYDLLQNTSNFEGNESIEFNFGYEFALMEYSRLSLSIHNS